MNREVVTPSALRYLELGYSVIPMRMNDKSPLMKWGEYYDRHASQEEVMQWPSCNISVVTGGISGVVVVDCDSLESYAGWLKNMPPTPLRVKSRRGMHFYYRHPGEYVKSASHVQGDGFEYDVKGDRSYAIAPPSIYRCHQYQVCVCSGNIRGKFLPPSSLPPFQTEWRPDTVPPSSSDSVITDGEAYIGQITAVSGEGGDRNTYRAACKLQESGLSREEAIAVLSRWNETNASPPWSVSELLHKIDMVYNGSGH